MNSRKTGVILAFLVTGLGVAWLLDLMGMIPGYEWVWSISLGVSGILLLALSAFSRFNFVIGTSLIVTCVLTVLRKTGQIQQTLEVPALFITLGILLLCLQLSPNLQPAKNPAIPTEGNL